MQNDLISRSALWEQYQTEYNHADALGNAHRKKGWQGALQLLYDAPAVDAVEVVRCKDCKFAYINSFSAAAGVAVCRKLSTEAGTAIRNHDDFCSYGKRREDDG